MSVKYSKPIFCFVAAHPVAGLVGIQATYVPRSNRSRATTTVLTEVLALGAASSSAYLQGMDTGPKIAQVAALVGDPARANMLGALMDGRTLTASELAYVSGVAPQTASGHLAKLTDAGLLALDRQGRRRYFRLTSPLVARMLEVLMVVAQEGPARQRNLWRGGETLRHARTCYDHMAGRIAVAIADRLVQQSFILLDEDGGQLTDDGRSFFDEVGVDLRLISKRRVFCRPCLDWSERRPHLAGAVGAAILHHALEHDWVEHVRDSRALVVTPIGVRGLATTFGIEGAPPTDGREGQVASLSRGRASDGFHFHNGEAHRQGVRQR